MKFNLSCMVIFFSSGIVDVAFSSGSTSTDQLKAVIIAEVMEYIAKHQLSISNDNQIFASSLFKIKVLKLPGIK